MAPSDDISEAEAIWSSGGRTFPVKVLSGPDVQGMVEVGFLWSGQRDRVRRGCLSCLNPAAEKLFSLVDRFVAVPSRPIAEKPVAPKKKKQPPPKVPGASIDYERAALIFPGIHRCHIPPTAKLTLLGHADGRVALRAYDRDQHLLGELFYEPPGQTGSWRRRPPCQPRPFLSRPLRALSRPQRNPNPRHRSPQSRSRRRVHHPRRLADRVHC